MGEQQSVKTPQLNFHHICLNRISKRWNHDDAVWKVSAYCSPKCFHAFNIQDECEVLQLTFTLTYKLPSGNLRSHSERRMVAVTFIGYGIYSVCCIKVKLLKVQNYIMYRRFTYTDVW